MASAAEIVVNVALRSGKVQRPRAGHRYVEPTLPERVDTTLSVGRA